jgi:S1-C subfamily serine protease
MPEEYIKFPQYIPRTCEIRLESNDRSFGFEVIHGDNGIGAYIQEVILGSPANRAGLRKSDRIITINDKYVDTSASKVIYEKLNKALIKRNVKLFVMDTETYKYNLLKDPSRKTNLFISVCPRITYACLI